MNILFMLTSFLMEEGNTGVTKVTTTLNNVQNDTAKIAFICFAIGGVIGAILMMFNSKLGKSIIISAVIGAVITGLISLGIIKDISNGWTGSGTQGGTVMITPMLE